MVYSHLLFVTIVWTIRVFHKLSEIGNNANTGQERLIRTRLIQSST